MYKSAVVKKLSKLNFEIQKKKQFFLIIVNCCSYYSEEKTFSAPSANTQQGSQLPAKVYNKGLKVSYPSGFRSNSENGSGFGGQWHWRPAVKVVDRRVGGPQQWFWSRCELHFGILLFSKFICLKRLKMIMKLLKIKFKKTLKKIFIGKIEKLNLRIFPSTCRFSFRNWWFVL